MLFLQSLIIDFTLFMTKFILKSFDNSIPRVSHKPKNPALKYEFSLVTGLNPPVSWTSLPNKALIKVLFPTPDLLII